ncbi:MAG: GGDEF domain-containing protein [Oribacterium sp.]|nr:GGDEF domain-containing protein [Oribacterium sp.]
MNENILFIELNVLCVTVLALILKKVVSGFRRSDRVNVSFTRVLTAHIFMTVFICVTELLSSFGGLGKDYRNLILISRTLCDITVYLAVYSWISFIIKTEKPSYERDKKGELFWAMPFVGLTALSLYSPFTRMFFYIDGSGMLHNGELALFQKVVVYMTALLASSTCFSNSKKCDDSDKRKLVASIALYPVLPFIASVTELYITSCLVPAASMLMLLTIYFNKQEMMVCKDPLTQLNNRTRLLRYLEERMETGKNGLYAIMMDINHFKDINDHYGHVEGDKMIVYVADSIRSVLDKVPRKTFLARYGGDEFILIVNMDSEGDIKNLIKAIKRKVGSFGPGLKKIPLSIACGYVKYDKKYCDIDSFIEAADEAMYRDKYKNRNDDSDIMLGQALSS